MTYEYKVEIFREGALSSVLLGSASTKTAAVEKKLNQLGADGWRLVNLEREVQRLWLFWTREAMVATFMRET